MSAEPLGQLEQRLVALEVKAAFAEDTLDQLNLVIYRQQQQIDDLVAQVVQLRQQRTDASGTGGARDPRDDLPPHY